MTYTAVYYDNGTFEESNVTNPGGPGNVCPGDTMNSPNTGYSGFSEPFPGGYLSINVNYICSTATSNPGSYNTVTNYPYTPASYNTVPGNVNPTTYPYTPESYNTVPGNTNPTNYPYTPASYNTVPGNTNPTNYPYTPASYNTVPGNTNPTNYIVTGKQIGRAHV